MKTFRIYSSAGEDMGTYRGNDERDAHQDMNACAGICTQEELMRVSGGRTFEELHADLSFEEVPS